MMYRNRKRESLHGGFVARALLACLYFGAVGMGYVWHKNQIYRLGDDIKRREADLAAVDKRTTVLAAAAGAESGECGAESGQRRTAGGD